MIMLSYGLDTTRAIMEMNSQKRSLCFLKNTLP